jgi:hypothetical protein
MAVAGKETLQNPKPYSAMNPSNSPDLSAPAGSQSGVQSAEASTASSSMAQAARESTAKVKAAATEAASQVASRAETMAGQKKDEAADRVDTYGSAIHESARSLEEQDPNIAWLTHQAADRLQGVASYLRERDFRGLRADAEDMARRHPAAFFGGMCVAGLVLGSVIKASQSAGTADGLATSGQSDFGGGGEASMAEAPGSFAAASTGPAAGI